MPRRFVITSARMGQFRTLDIPPTFDVHGLLSFVYSHWVGSYILYSNILRPHPPFLFVFLV